MKGLWSGRSSESSKPGEMKLVSLLNDIIVEDNEDEDFPAVRYRFIMSAFKYFEVCNNEYLIHIIICTVVYMSSLEHGLSMALYSLAQW